VIIVRHTEEEIQAAAERFDRWADELDPATAEVTDVSDLRAVAEAADAVRADEARLTEAVTRARAHGRSWTRIADSMGVSRQAARQRFADKVDA
jgi:BRCT domain type II-containing protein